MTLPRPTTSPCPAYTRPAGALLLAWSALVLAGCPLENAVIVSGEDATDPPVESDATPEDNGAGGGGDSEGAGGGGEGPPETKPAAGVAGGTGNTGGVASEEDWEAQCAKNLSGRVRRFRSHTTPGMPPAPESPGANGLKYLLKPELDHSGRPVYNADPAAGHGVSLEDFTLWFRDVQGANDAFQYVPDFHLVETEQGRLGTLGSKHFSPSDPADENVQDLSDTRGFTYELHSSFRYRRGDTLLVQANDNVWVFINRIQVLASDGRDARTPGIEPGIDIEDWAAGRNVKLEPGKMYPLDVFVAKRGGSESAFELRTAVDFFCDVVPR
ncbi:fibro-slime domain-containing protein [Sorangium sp. So ce131]|uniref:fibro-slime domain-containing protein n=1 Tax=Sorangium sp. So ce131 TaxID=3133282 RepID=UPI003F5F428A